MMVGLVVVESRVVFCCRLYVAVCSECKDTVTLRGRCPICRAVCTTHDRAPIGHSIYRPMSHRPILVHMAPQTMRMFVSIDSRGNIYSVRTNGMTVIKLFFPTKTKVETEQTGRIAARLERAVPVAPGMLIALMDHSQVEHEDYISRVTLLDDLDLFKDQEYSGSWGLDVLDVPPRVKKWLRSE